MLRAPSAAPDLALAADRGLHLDQDRQEVRGIGPQSKQIGNESDCAADALEQLLYFFGTFAILDEGDHRIVPKKLPPRPALIRPV